MATRREEKQHATTDDLPPISKYEWNEKQLVQMTSKLNICFQMGGNKLLGYLEGFFNLSLNNGEILHLLSSPIFQVRMI